MKRSDLFYIWVAITGYLAGVFAYLTSLRSLEGSDFIHTEQLVAWTLFPFFTVGILLYLLCVIVLRSINRYYLWLQTLAFILVGIVPITMIPFLMGSFSAANFRFVFSPEGFFFMLFFTTTAIVCSYGTWVAQKRLDKKPFLILFVLIVLAFAIVIAV
ncbi:hypothetical protein [Paenibacillus lemnae]|uniref:Uncharacterized protein n=1 Tax=Paenibacillus lemnae TaxID=1330551 RepID=A0A848MC40_PAELE|nr:hypothetical protein [Paenibacillus lemnae]NMO97710.1 hypothetical protein [Paenibacillus lemnae]